MVEIKHLCLCLLFSSTHFSIYKDTFAFYKDTKCVQGHAILMPAPNHACILLTVITEPTILLNATGPQSCGIFKLYTVHYANYLNYLKLHSKLHKRKEIFIPNFIYAV